MLKKVRPNLPPASRVKEIVAGHIAFQLRGKSFARLSGYNNELLSRKTDLETQEFPVTHRKYAKSSHIGRQGWLTHVADRSID